MTCIAKEELLRLIENKPSLITDYLCLQDQVQPNGIDLTLKEVFNIDGPGVIPVDNAQRKLSSLSPLPFDGKDRIHLKPGDYLITYNEVVSLPKDVMALGRTRSSLLRCGAAIHTAVWDAGYSGRSQSLVVVYNKDGIILEKNARLLQLVFFRLGSETEGYSGIYQNENIR
ncbi:deoxyuridine 5'-triphosphate nucleotidohydrolase [Dehalogenimonas etheniformans]|uniref:Deoxyuridine 5'-triphosphate nucleotidohydrolase n=1 Tax=Dehalogenimonas etheniformans TaxID=1536648 RepID=A0A2P5P587_9CHLR|nr:deoxyuridine 5'-triphosphate nucleotidohydrolase [Dehalogenimonas etheniformans]PPD57447.1 deoxyuridine 5'-triphosphate nucleotidohydrolase [Dehalogenimonas etheniformans]QNT77177.1 deoxyuridine 5'-triphosphate nucleotidohydrolase [Dehalogenimonas etheniformans]